LVCGGSFRSSFSFGPKDDFKTGFKIEFNPIPDRFSLYDPGNLAHQSHLRGVIEENLFKEENQN
jgi:hypothetical protein